MPHMRIEYSANLEDRLNMKEFCETISTAILETGLFEVGAVRVRMFRTEHYAIADRLPANSFLDMTFRIGEGRSSAERRRAGEAIFHVASGYLEPLFETPHFALSMQIEEIDSDMSWKKNGMHGRLRAS